MAEETPTTDASSAIALGSNEAIDTLNRYAETIADHMNELDLIKQHIKEAKAEAKSQGFDVKALMGVVKAKLTNNQTPRVERETLDRSYLRAAGYPVGE